VAGGQVADGGEHGERAQRGLGAQLHRRAPVAA
jgi:hypothetical protein